MHAIDALMDDHDQNDDCWNCGGDGYIEGDCTCGEDCCCCLEPEPPICDICRGKGHLKDDPAPPNPPARAKEQIPPEKKK